VQENVDCPANEPAAHASILYKEPVYFLMAEKARKIPIDLDGDDMDEISFEAANAIPGVQDDREDEEQERIPIDLDTPYTPFASAKTTESPRTLIIEPGPIEASEEMEELRSQTTIAKDNYLRTLAEFQNYKRRGDAQKQLLRQEANERLIKELLPILDDFDLALDAASKSESYEQLIGGVSAILRKFQDTLAKEGVNAIPAVGEPFNTEVHEAVMLDEESDLPDETVSAELRKGYTLHDRVIRPSLVKVAKSG
jgi:molecular chaperone GrpE